MKFVSISKLILMFYTIFCFQVIFAQQPKNEIGLSLFSFHMLDGTYYLRPLSANITPLNGITYKRELNKNFSARALIGFESGTHIFPEFDASCADCGRGFSSSKSGYAQLGLQYNYRYRFVEPYIYTDLRYLRTKNYREYANYAWGAQVGASRLTTNGYGFALGAGLQVHLSEKLALTYEPAIIRQANYNTGNGIHNGVKWSVTNEKEKYSKYRPVSVFSVNLAF